MAFAKGKVAIAHCDMCDKKMRYLDLLVEIMDGKPTGFLVCDECLDKDQPQFQLKYIKVSDPQALRNPRPDKDDVGNLSPADRQAIQDFIDAYTSGTG